MLVEYSTSLLSFKGTTHSKAYNSYVDWQGFLFVIKTCYKVNCVDGKSNRK